MVYFAVIAIFYAIQTGEGASLLQVQAYINFGTNLIQFIYLSIPFFRHRLRQYYLPIALIYATVLPIFSNLIYLADPQEELAFLITRSWLLFPILIIPIVMIAGQYAYRYVVVIIIISTYVELFSLVPHIQNLSTDNLQILGGPLIRAFAFGTLGHIVGRMVAIQQMQRRELMRANLRLSEHAETLEQLATSRERNRIARELHDTLAHTLSGQAVHLEAIKMLVPADQTEMLQMLDQALETTRSGLAETRRALKDLRALQLDDLGLALSLQALAYDAASRAEFKLEIDFPEQLPELTPDIEQSIYRVAQESFENIVRHAKAQQVKLSAEYNTQTFEMNIQDNGAGFNPQKIDPDKLGIQGMHERAALIGAQLQIESTPQKGTRVRFALPYYRIHHHD